MRADWLEFVRRVHEITGLNLGKRLVNVTEELIYIFIFQQIALNCYIL